MNVIKTALLLFCALPLFACSGNDQQAAVSRGVPVRVASVSRQDLVREIRAVGNVAPSATVNIIPRVTGEITAVHFREGDEVKTGQNLLQIDPRPYQAAYSEKKANLGKDLAQLKKAQDDRQRFAKLVNGGYVSREAYDQAVTEARMLEAVVEADRAALDNAALELSYCSIVSPIDGRAGILNLHKGNIIKSASSEPITRIDTISPSYVHFSVPEIHLPAIMENMEKGKVPVTAVIPDGGTETGELDLFDNTVDSATGTIRLRGVFANEQRHLWPGQFVNVILPLGQLEQALTVPTGAIQPGREGSFVYIIDENGAAIQKNVTPVFENGGVTAFEGDVREDQKVVTEGQLRLRPGLKVEILPD